jgi:hypothetical protein
VTEDVQDAALGAEEDDGRRAHPVEAVELWIAPDFDAPLEEFKEYME